MSFSQTDSFPDKCPICHIHVRPQGMLSHARKHGITSKRQFQEVEKQFQETNGPEEIDNGTETFQIHNTPQFNENFLTPQQNHSLTPQQNHSLTPQQNPQLMQAIQHINTISNATSTLYGWFKFPINVVAFVWGKIYIIFSVLLAVRMLNVLPLSISKDFDLTLAEFYLINQQDNKYSKLIRFLMEIDVNKNPIAEISQPRQTGEVCNQETTEECCNCNTIHTVYDMLQIQNCKQQQKAQGEATTCNLSNTSYICMSLP